MQHQQQVGGGGPQPLGGYGHPQGGAAAEMVIGDEDQKLGDLGIAEAASPISSRPPAPAAIGNNNFEEMIQATAEVGGSSGNRWPRQETLALLQIRSEMDAAFRDATLKGPLWEQVSRKLAELGYKRSAKKCKEKFENVHKYYKRTKEGRGGRQDGKSYKFFSQLEALHHNTSTAVQGLPRIGNPTSVPVAVSLPPPIPQPNATVVPAVSLPPPDHIATGTRDGSAVPLFGNVGVSFSTNSSSSSEGEDEEDEEEMEMDSTENPNQRKRKRSHGGTGSVDGDDQRMMDFFEGLLKQVMQKQEAMQQKFLEAIEKREQDRMIREEAWKRQDMTRIAREQELMAQERAISSSRDAAIIAFLEKITGQTIHLPTTVPQNPPPPVPAAADATTTAAAVPPPSEPQEQHHRQPTFQQQRQSERPNNQNQRDQPQSIETIEAHQVIKSSSDIIAAAPKQQIPVQDFTGGSIMETTSSRWPKAEVLALIELRSGMESKYQEAGPKGPLWEEISAGMQRMGYNRSAKRCKEKWENINKYFKKVKESNKKRPEDSKTCPYFHELDALYRKKILGSTSGNVVDVGGSSSLSEPERKLQQQQDIGMLPSQSLASNVSEDKDGRRTELHASGVGAFSSTPFGQHNRGNTGGEKQPEDMLKKQHQQSHGDMINNCHNSVDCSSSNDLDQENDEDNYEEVDENEEYDDKTEEETRMVYKIQFQRQNVGSSNGGRTAPSSIVAMVQ